MKVSELNLSLIAEHCRIVEEDLTDLEKSHINALKIAAIKYCAGYTGLSEEELDDYEDITIAVLCLISDMYDNRIINNFTYATKRPSNSTVETILGMHCLNLIPEEVV